MTALSSSAVEALRKSGDDEKQRVIKDVLMKLEKGEELTGSYAIQKWLELAAVHNLHTRMTRQEKVKSARERRE